MRFGAALLAPTALLSSAGAVGQPATDVPQISNAKSSVTEDVLPPLPPMEAPAQVSQGTDSTPAEAQLTSVRTSHGELKQLSSRAPTAEPPLPLSRPAQGRTAAVERIHGSDRCDSAIAKEKQPDSCKQVIETRADEYARPEPMELTPEQRLLTDQQLRSAGDPIANATRRLATSGEPDDSTEAMGIAAIVLQQSQQQQEQQKKDEDPAASAAVQAIMQMMNVTPQN